MHHDNYQQRRGKLCCGARAERAAAKSPGVWEVLRARLLLYNYIMRARMPLLFRTTKIN